MDYRTAGGIAAMAAIALCALLAGCAGSRGREAAGPGSVPAGGDAAGAASLPSAGDAAIAAILAEECRRAKVPAMSAAVVSSAGLRKAAVAGTLKWGGDEPAALDSLWHLGSDTKIMTATLAATLVEEGRLSWTSSVSEVFPELAPSFSPELRGVTLVQLLSHRAGLPANLDYGALERLGSARDQRIGAVRAGLSAKPVNAPGSEYLYSNLGYIVVGAMIERAGGTDWESLLRTRVFEPLGMGSAGFGGLNEKGKSDQPWGHRALGSPPGPEGADIDNPPVLGPAGRVHCSIQDWAKFIADQLRGARGEKGLLRPESYRMLQSAQYPQDYALGWGLAERDWAGGKALTHAGSNTYYLALAWLAPKKDFAVLVCANAGLDAFAAADAAAGRIIRTLGGGTP